LFGEILFFFQVEKHRRDPTRIGGTEVKEEAGLTREGRFRDVKKL
jgi:hypothetical protein